MRRGDGGNTLIRSPCSVAVLTTRRPTRLSVRLRRRESMQSVARKREDLKTLDFVVIKKVESRVAIES